ncbi:putative leucine-rich repeat-containing protein DDB_G0290503 [Chironomus tepperi]|uniref:putative leucine-rich repeat-containing protein DDB_G0290503 n=1 Tax=Chironomus tepperi TaxID=113505 RepID=UPI00391EF995
MNFIKKSFTNQIKYKKIDSGDQQNKRKGIMDRVGAYSNNQAFEQQVSESLHFQDVNGNNSNQDKCLQTSKFATNKRKLVDGDKQVQRKLDRCENSKIVKLDQKVRMSVNLELNQTNHSNIANEVQKYPQIIEENGTKTKKLSTKVQEFDKIEEISGDVNLSKQIKNNKNKMSGMKRVRIEINNIKSMWGQKTTNIRKTSTISKSGNENLQISENYTALNPEVSTVGNLCSSNKVTNKKSKHSVKFPSRKLITKAWKNRSAVYQVEKSQHSAMRVKKLSDMPKYRRIRSKSVDQRIDEEKSSDLREVFQESVSWMSKSTENIDNILDCGRIEADDSEDEHSRNNNLNHKIEINPKMLNCESFKILDENVNQKENIEEVNQEEISKNCQVHDHQLQLSSIHQNSINHTSLYASKFARSIQEYSQNNHFNDANYENFKDLSILSAELSISEQQLKLNERLVTCCEDKESTISGSYKIEERIKDSEYKLRNLASYAENTMKIMSLNQTIERSLRDIEEISPCPSEDVAINSQSWNLSKSSFSNNLPNLSTNQDKFTVNPSETTQLNPQILSEYSVIAELRKEIQDLRLQNQLKDLKIDQLEKCEKIKDKQIEKITKIAMKKFSEVQKRENLLKIVKIQSEVLNEVAKVKTELKMKSLEVEKFKEVMTKKDEIIVKLDKKLNSNNSKLKSQLLTIEELQKVLKLRTNELAVMGKCWEESHEFACKLYEVKRNEWKQKLLDLKKVINNLELRVDSEELKLPKIPTKKITSTSTVPNINEITKKFIEKNFEAEMIPKLIKCLDNIEN